jgi:hypothetical protein
MSVYLPRRLKAGLVEPEEIYVSVYAPQCLKAGVVEPEEICWYVCLSPTLLSINTFPRQRRIFGHVVFFPVKGK